METDRLKTYIMPAVLRLCEDPQDSVRLLAVPVLVALRKRMPPAEAPGLILLALNICRDSSWRVRYMVADKFVEICLAFKENDNSKEASNLFIEGYSNLLLDSEAEVRTAAASKCVGVATSVGSAVFVKHLLPHIQTLATDSCDYTRAALASVVMGLTSVLDKESVFTFLVPLYLVLLRDSNPEVR